MSRTPEYQGSLLDLLYEAVVAGGAGGTVIWLVFLLVDSVTGRALYTPTLLGSTLFLGADPSTVTSVNLGAVAVYTVAHFFVFFLLGFVGALLVRTMEATQARPMWVTLVLFGLLEAAFLLSTRALTPELAETLRYPRLAITNLFAAATMVAVLHRLRRGEEARHHDGTAGDSPAPI